MNSAPSSPAGDVDALRTLVITATQRLLGDTIAVTDDQWRAPSRLPGWTRGHVATHIARQADALVRVVSGARSGAPEPMYRDPDQREAEIEAGAGRSGLELQIDLDTSAGALSEAFDAAADESAWEVVTELRGGITVPLRLLPLARLSEVVLHHVDLDVGMSVDDIDDATAGWLLEWVAFRVSRRPDFPRVRVVSDAGSSLTLGRQEDAAAGDVPEVRGSSARLLGWLTGRRADGDTLGGAEGVRLPPF
jgi:maleylpyruvate isomerase